MTAPAKPKYTNPCLEWHMRFICPECGKEFASQQEWRRHLNEVHDYLSKTAEDFNFVEINDRYHECQECHKWVANAHQAIALLQYHRFLHLPYSRTYRCSHCEASFARKRALCEHLYAYHSRIIERMEKLQKAEKAAEVAAVRNPKENPEFYMRFVCPQCNKSIDRFQEWIHHLDTAHQATSTDLRMHRITGTTNHYCKQCRKIFYTSNKAKLQRHHFEHLPYKLYFQCAFCTVKKAYKSEMLRHFITCHPKQYATARPYVRKPIEWASEVNAKLNLELDTLLSQPVSPLANAKPTDLIQKALLNSRIDLEQETMPDKSVGSRLGGPAKNDSMELDKLCSAVLQELDAEVDKGAKASAVKRKAAGLTASTPPAPKIVKLSDAKTSLNVPRPVFQRSPPSGKPPILTKVEAHKMDDDQLSRLLENYFTYMCPECGVDFDQHSHWRAHVIKAHNMNNLLEKNFRPVEGGGGYVCLDCHEVQNTTSHSMLQRHRFRHMPHKHYLKCNRCGECKPNKPKMFDHLRNKHPEICTNVRSKLRPMPPKTSDARRLPKHHCAYCGKGYITEGRWASHQRQCSKATSAATVTRNYNIEENMRLLAHLKKAQIRLRSYMREHNIEPTPATLD